MSDETRDGWAPITGEVVACPLVVTGNMIVTDFARIPDPDDPEGSVIVPDPNMYPWLFEERDGGLVYIGPADLWVKVGSGLRDETKAEPKEKE